MLPAHLVSEQRPRPLGRGESSHWWFWDGEIDLSGSLRRVWPITDGEFCHPATSRQPVLSSFKGTMAELSPVYEAHCVVFVCVTVKLLLLLKAENGVRGCRTCQFTLKLLPLISIF